MPSASAIACAKGSRYTEGMPSERAVLITRAAVAAAWLLTAAPAGADSAGQLDLTLYGGPLISTSGEDNVDALGFAIGASAFVRLGELLGLGLVLEHDQIGWAAEGGPAITDPGSSFPDVDGSITHQYALLAARLYFLKAGPADLFAQLGAGVGDVSYAPYQLCSLEDGFAAQLALGAEWRLARSLGLHTSLAATPFGWGMGCNGVGYPGRPQEPYAHFGLSARIGLTSVWASP